MTARHTVLRTLIFVNAAVFWLYLKTITPADAQTALSAVTQEKLAKLVHLSLGSTTLAQATFALSTQTGLSVEAAPYLRTRNLVVEIDNLTAKAALSALSECNDWRWSEDSPGHILVSRPLPHRPRNVEELSKSVVAALPKDVRDFVYIGHLLEDVKQMVMSADKLREPGPLHFGIPHSSWDGTKIKLGQLINHYGATILTLLEPAPRQGSYYAYEKLSPEAKQQVLLFLFLDTLFESGKSVMYNDYTPFQLDMNKAVVELKNGLLMVGSHTQINGLQRFDFFAAPITP